MIEPYPAAERLSTWQVSTWPLAEGSAVTALPRHRRAYLEFEGPLSADRGNVRRVAEGLCRMTHKAQCVVIQLDDSTEAWVLGEVVTKADRLAALEASQLPASPTIDR
jgi:hypothetical protein